MNYKKFIVVASALCLGACGRADPADPSQEQEAQKQEVQFRDSDGDLLNFQLFTSGCEDAIGSWFASWNSLSSLTVTSVSIKTDAFRYTLRFPENGRPSSKAGESASVLLDSSYLEWDFSRVASVDLNYQANGRDQTARFFVPLERRPLVPSAALAVTSVSRPDSKTIQVRARPQGSLVVSAGVLNQSDSGRYCHWAGAVGGRNGEAKTVAAGEEVSFDFDVVDSASYLGQTLRLVLVGHDVATQAPLWIAADVPVP
jgi:hypothetical protein